MSDTSNWESENENANCRLKANIRCVCVLGGFAPFQSVSWQCSFRNACGFCGSTRFDWAIEGEHQMLAVMAVVVCQPIKSSDDAFLSLLAPFTGNVDLSNWLRLLLLSLPSFSSFLHLSLIKVRATFWKELSSSSPWSSSSVPEWLCWWSWPQELKSLLSLSLSLSVSVSVSVQVAVTAHS